MSSHTLSRPRLRTREVWLLLAAAWFGLLLTAAGCRDTREDSSFCKNCPAEASTTMDAGATGSQEAAQSTSAESSANTSQPSGVSTGSPAMRPDQAGTAGPNKGSSGSGPATATAGNRAVAGGARDAGPSSSSGSAGAAASSGSSGNATEGGRGAAASSGGNAPRDAGTGQEPVQRDAGHMEPLPCNGACPPERPVCDESVAPGRCVQCTGDDNHACVGDTKVCDAESMKCVQCTVDDLSGCAGELKACNPNKRCVRCTATDPNSCPAAQPFCENEQRCLECMPGTIGQCLGDRDLCNAEGRCIQCEDNTRCLDGNAARCDRQTNTCVGCENDNDCSDRFPATPRCDKGTRRCVACSPDGPPTCGPGMYCNPANYVCTPGGPDKVGCSPCNGPKECAPSPEISACVPAGNNESYCFDAAIGGNCHSGYTAQPVPGHDTTPYCLPPSMSSCPAINNALMGKPCTKDKEAECGKNGVCLMSTGTCSLKCSGNPDCPQTLTCKDNVCVKQ